MRKKQFVFIFGLLLIGMLSNVSNANQSLDSAETPYAYLYYSDFSSITYDGVIDEGEYPDQHVLVDLAGDKVLELAWAHNNTMMSIALSIDGTGWLGIGFGPVGIGMAGSDIVMSRVVGENVTQVVDKFGTGNVPPTNDTDAYPFPVKAGTEVGGVTTVEFVIPMKSDDTQGQDRNWDVGGTYGFFVAYRKTLPNFTFIHDAHSEKLNVEILDDSFAAPEKMEQDFSVSTTGTKVTLTTTVSGLTNVEGIEIQFYLKTLFGKALIGTATTDASGVASLEYEPARNGEHEFIALFLATVSITRDEAIDTIDFDGVDEVHGEEESWFVENHFMRSFILSLFFMIILSLIYTYGTVVYDIVFKMRKIGDEVSEVQK